jgi:hypothetical protein
MIRVNLLPEEYRKVESTSLSLFLMFLVGVVLVALAFVFWLTLSLQGGSIATELEESKARLAKVTDEAKAVDRLEADLAHYNKRLRTIMSIRGGRIYWSKKLDLLVRDTPRNIWFVSIRMSQTDPIEIKPGEVLPATADGGYLELNCFQKTDDYEILAGYRDTLIRDRVFYADFARIQAPFFTTAVWPSAVEEDQVTLSFKVVLYLKPQELAVE